MSRLAFGVVIVTHDSAAHLPETLAALTPQLRDDDQLAIVDNASGDGTAALARGLVPDALVLETGANLGFAGGCNAGARATGAPLLFFLNPDAPPGPGCLDALRAAADAHPAWGAWQALVTLPGGERVNTSGGVTHFLGFGWAGACGEPVRSEPDREVSFASGAALVVRRSAWDEVGGFDERYFMYVEDLDLSLRLRLAGHAVGLAATAVVEHDYEFERGARKWFLLERNRWRTLLRVYPTALLVLLAPALLAFEVALLPLAARGGWLGAKLRAQRAVLCGLPQLLRARRDVQARSRGDTAAFARALTAQLDSPYLGTSDRLGPLVRLQARYWRIVVRLVGGA